jgi:entry exclusion lipoprotein TrbK
MHIKIRQLALAAFVVAFVSGCGKKEEPPPAQPQADACAANKDWVTLNEAQRAELCNKCPRCGTFVPSEQKKW